MSRGTEDAVIDISVLGTVSRPWGAQGKQSSPCSPGVQARGLGALPGLYQPVSREAMTTVPLGNEERTVAMTPTPECFQN